MGIITQQLPYDYWAFSEFTLPRPAPGPGERCAYGAPSSFFLGTIANPFLEPLLLPPCPLHSFSPEGIFSLFLCPPQLAVLLVTLSKPPELRAGSRGPVLSPSSQVCWRSSVERGSQLPPPKVLRPCLIHSPHTGDQLHLGHLGQ